MPCWRPKSVITRSGSVPAASIYFEDCALPPLAGNGWFPPSRDGASMGLFVSPINTSTGLGIVSISLAMAADVAEKGRTAFAREISTMIATHSPPVEAVVRGYLIGSGWKDYLATGQVCGIELPTGLRMADRLPRPIFTPSMTRAA